MRFHRLSSVLVVPLVAGLLAGTASGSAATARPGEAPPVTLAAQQAAAASDGLLVTHRQFIGNDGTLTYTGFDGSAMEFSPDGAQIAGIGPESGPDGSTVVAWSNDGEMTELATVLGEIVDMSWSGDQSQLAVLTDDGDQVRRIYRVPLDGSAATVLVRDTATFRIMSFSYASSQITWNPAGNEIAFIATPTDPDGSSYSFKTDQIYTVSAAGGAPAHFNAVYDDPGCSTGPSCTYYNYDAIDWSPDGSRIAALVNRERYSYAGSGTSELFLATVARSASLPTRVRTISIFTDVDEYSHRGSAPLLWSTDGARLTYEHIQENYDLVPTTVAVAGGAVVGTHPYRFLFNDRQPCPTGVCAPWGRTAPRARATLKGRVPVSSWKYGGRPTVTGTLAVTPAQNAAGTVKLIVDGRARGSSRLTAAMRNVFSFRLPKLPVGVHKIQLRYGGSALVSAAATGYGRVRVVRR